jgi:AraC-like DNA-binding protein
MELGANDYLTTPFTLEEFLRAITAQLDKQIVMQQWYTKQSQTVPKPPSTNKTTFTAAPESIFPSDSKLSQVFHFIEANYNQPIALKDVAQAVGYSPAYLTNLIRRQTGQTVQRWIIERRMAAARSLLLETDQVVTQIAAQVGYHHVVHFFRQFRQIHGTTPQAWRSANRA